jgi:glycosyltransferase involved in cell wall biosynthesis
VQAIIPAFRSLPHLNLLVAGTGDHEAELRALAAGASNIRFLGRVDHAELRALYRDAIATIVPSLCYETFGLVVVESFSTATPVIVHAQSSLQELITAHGGGIQYRTETELIAGITRLSSEPALRARLGREGRTAYDAEFGESAFLTHYEELVRALLVNKRRGGTALAAPPEDRVAGRQVFHAH